MTDWNAGLTVVFLSSRKRVDELYDKLFSEMIPVVKLHACVCSFNFVQHYL
jgi:hypothetical protein